MKRKVPLIETDEPENDILDLMGNVRIKPKPRPTLLTNAVHNGNMTSEADMDSQEKTQENCEASRCGDEEEALLEENKNSYEVPIPPKSPWVSDLPALEAGCHIPVTTIESNTDLEEPSEHKC